MSKLASMNKFCMCALPFYFAAGSVVTLAQERVVEPVVEEVVVTGFRGSLETAVDVKRDAKNITDNIYAEDIGKSSDQNIADALSRVTGVSINRQDGEGTTVTIRGASPGNNIISLNGIQLTNPSNSDAVDLSSFSSDILSSIQVYKTSSADQDEGSLGGTVVLNTFRPLDAKKEKRVLEIQARQHELAEEDDYKISGAFSKKLMDNKLGVSGTIFVETQAVRRDQSSVTAYEDLDVLSSQVLDQNGRSLTRFELNDDGTQRLDGDGNPVVAEIQGLSPDSVRYSSFLNNRDRTGGTFALQFQPSARTDIQFDLSHTVQNLVTDDNAAATIGDRGVPSNGQLRNHFREQWRLDNPLPDNFDALSEGERTSINDTRAATATDFANQQLALNPPSNDQLEQWTTFDTSKGIFTKSLSRFGQGRNSRNFQDVDNETTVVSLDIEHQVGDFTFNLLAGLSESESTDNDFFNVTTNNFNFATPIAVWRTPAIGTGEPGQEEIQPVGFDCTTGSCRLITGTSLIRRGPAGAGVDFNQVATGYNPNDLDGNHLQQFTIRDRRSSDESESFFFDVDWDVNIAGFDLIEAGFKYSSREKDIRGTNVQFANNRVGNDTGAVLIFDDPSISTVAEIPLNAVAEENRAFDGFLSDLDFPRDNLSNGWPGVDGQAAADIILPAIHLRDSEVPGDLSRATRVGRDYQIAENDANSRNIVVDATAIYLKGNFAYFDERLTGDIGVRYVKTENSASGTASINLVNRNRADIDRREIIDNASLPVCESSKEFARNRADLGPSLDIPGYNSSLSDDELKALNWAIRFDPVTETRPNPQDGIKLAHRDARREEVDRGAQCFDPILRDNTGQEDWRFVPQDVTGAVDPNFSIGNTGESDLVLPSLNLNFDINDHLVARFGVSKTMARPAMDSLQAGFRFGEGGNPLRTGNGAIRNTNLQPLESDNFDLSLEWYFNDKGGLLSAAFFRKDFSNFEESETVPVFLLDVRGRSNEELSQLTPLDFTLTDADTSRCFPNRPTVFNPPRIWQNPRFGYRDPNNPGDSTGIADCREIQLRRIINGSGGSVSGIEMTYQQTYDQLPGFWSGLGSSLNVTLQETKTDRQESSVREGEFLPQFPFGASPEETYNATLYWEKGGSLVRFAYNYASDVLRNRSFGPGLALWEEGGGTLDISANFQLTDWMQLTMNAVNVTSENRRQYVTSVTNRRINNTLGLDSEIGEGNVFENSSADRSRTHLESTTSPIYRLGLRVTF